MARAKTSRRSPAALHQEQADASGCVAACICILQRWLGEDPDEDALRRDLEHAAGLRLAAGVADWEFRYLDWDKSEDRMLLDAYLGRGVWLMVDVYPGPMTMHHERHPPAAESRFGPLMRRSPEDIHKREDLSRRIPQHPHHAIVLVECLPEGYRYLDPWYPRDGQPFTIQRRDFALAWTGQVVIPQKV
ncbi:hypothetical protein [Polyangium sorediatum]|uniref:Peptidase C39 domain-containing protein n=1 Tax=Polyangium sorediatum TaxID=889274 RepID=A0ABT6P0X3_9BACT|nr:hypothetical protein [Polyangium sorediatum]MDI1434262.1 hypothetical protein [Polyangium sorediatum]